MKIIWTKPPWLWVLKQSGPVSGGKYSSWLESVEPACDWKGVFFCLAKITGFSTSERNPKMPFCWSQLCTKSLDFLLVEGDFVGDVFYRWNLGGGGGFKYFLFSPLLYLRKIPILTSIFFKWVVQPPTRNQWPLKNHHLKHVKPKILQSGCPAGSDRNLLVSWLSSPI